MKYLIRFITRNAAGGVEQNDKIVDAPAITIGRATDQVLHIKDRRARLQQLVFTLRHRAAADSVRVWRECVHDAHIQQREALCRNSKHIAQWLKRPMVHCFHLWRELVALAVADRAKVRLMPGRLKHLARHMRTRMRASSGNAKNSAACSCNASTRSAGTP